MKAEAKSLRFLGESPQKLTIPFFQRHYVWKEENWQELLESLEGTEIKPFLGSIILKMTNNPLGPSEAGIIDGQQRLTTLTILAKAIYDSLPESIKLGSGVRRDIESFLFYRENASDDFDKSHVKIEHSRTDIEDYSKIIKAGLLSEDSINYKEIQSNSGAIQNCYKYFREKLEGKSVDELKQLHNSMFNDARCMLVLIILEYLLQLPTIAFSTWL
jgi:uncharacterized protein with ParB-like and HNH nuclease domain